MKPITGTGKVKIRAFGKKWGFGFDVTKEIPLEFTNGRVMPAVYQVPEMRGQVMVIEGRIEGDVLPEEPDIS